jgi:DNA-3-methyladenine glycosylase II
MFAPVTSPALSMPRLYPQGLSYDPDLARRHLAQADPVMGGLIARVGEFTLRPQPAQSLFAALLQSIVYQQLTGKAAATILGRVRSACAPRRFPTPRDILDIPSERLREAGLSTAKTAAVRDLAAKTLDGTVPSLARIRRMQDEEVIERLTTVRGIGRWTVEMLLIFRLGRPDVLPTTDLGVRKGFALLYRKRKLPDPAVMIRQGECWRPYRSVAAWYLWRVLDR